MQKKICRPTVRIFIAINALINTLPQKLYRTFATGFRVTILKEGQVIRSTCPCVVCLLRFSLQGSSLDNANMCRGCHPVRRNVCYSTRFSILMPSHYKRGPVLADAFPNVDVTDPPILTSPPHCQSPTKPWCWT